ncbi:MAG: hypothetical protein HY821_11685 [Acidobacteria bacterium]|nr:hypothetical protein [Acidobacteriota bacterium]
MRTQTGNEARAIEHLIAQIDSIDQWRDRVGRRVVCLFLLVFVAALTLLYWVARQGPPASLKRPEGPRAPAVLQNFLRR